jgi:DNA-binding cell septation regulator SpoVG
MKITNVKVRKIIPQNGLVGFANVVLDDCLFLGDIAIFTKLNKSGFRLIFPEKKIAGKKIPIFNPITKDFYFFLEEEINKQFNELNGLTKAE